MRLILTVSEYSDDLLGGDVVRKNHIVGGNDTPRMTVSLESSDHRQVLLRSSIHSCNVECRAGKVLQSPQCLVKVCHNVLRRTVQVLSVQELRCLHGFSESDCFQKVSTESTGLYKYLDGAP